MIVYRKKKVFYPFANIWNFTYNACIIVANYNQNVQCKKSNTKESVCFHMHAMFSIRVLLHWPFTPVLGLTSALWVEGGVLLVVFSVGSCGVQRGSGFEFGQRERLSVLLQRVLLQLDDRHGGERTRHALIRVFTCNTNTRCRINTNQLCANTDHFPQSNTHLYLWQEMLVMSD